MTRFDRQSSDTVVLLRIAAIFFMVFVHIPPAKIPTHFESFSIPWVAGIVWSDCSMPQASYWRRIC
jgi:hypothetical protein